MSKNVLLGASWCAPCKMVKQFLDNRGITYEYIDIDTDEGMEMAQDYKVRGVPTMVIIGMDGSTVITSDKKIKEAFDE